MKNIIMLIFLSFSFYAKGQFAVVADKDGFVNVRKEPKLGDNIIDTLQNGQLIYCLEKEANWTYIDFNEGQSGYIYKDRYFLVSDFEAIPTKNQTVTNITLEKDSITVIIKRGYFDKSKHKYKYVIGSETHIELIDGKKCWGIDGGFPNTEYESVLIKIGNRRVELPNEAIADLYEPLLTNTKVFYDRNTSTLYIQSMNSDGAGGYFVIWKIVKGKYKERYVVYGF